MSIIKSFGWRLEDPEWHLYNDGVLSPGWSRRSKAVRSYFVYSAVRNPFDRLISGWRYLPSTKTRSLLAVLKDPPRHGADYRHLTRPQIDILRDPVSKRLVTDDIIRFEHLQANFDRICDRIGVARRVLPHVNGGERAREYRQYFDDESRSLAEKMFREDLDVFGYQF